MTRDNRTPRVYVRDERAGIADERADDVSAIAAALRVALERGASFDRALREIEADRLADRVF